MLRLLIPEPLKLVDDIVAVLSGQPGRNGLSLKVWAVAEGAIPHHVLSRIDTPFPAGMRPAIPMRLRAARHREETVQSPGPLLST